MDEFGRSAHPLYRQVAARIRAAVDGREYGVDGRLPPEAELANRFGVSRGTLRQALGTLVREGLVATVPGRGTFVIRGVPPDPGPGAAEAGGRVGIVIPAVARMRIPELIAGAEARLRAAGYSLLLGSSGDDREQEAEQVLRFVRDGVSGLVVYPVDGPPNLELLGRLAAEAFPLVLIDRYLLDLGLEAVVADNFGGAFLAVRHLVERGFARIGFAATCNLSTSSIAERQAGYRWALEQHGHGPAPRLVCTDLDRLFHWPAPPEESKRNRRLLGEYLTGPDRPDAVFAVNDSVAFQILEVAASLGLRVPDDLAVVGFDNLAYPDYGGMPLTSVEQPRQEIGATAARILLEQIAGRRGPAGRIVLATRLIVRSSSGGPDAGAPSSAHRPALVESR